MHIDVGAVGHQAAVPHRLMGAATGLKQMGCRGTPHLSASIVSIALGPLLLLGDMSAIRHSLACRHY